MAVKPVEKSQTQIAQNPGDKRPKTGGHRRDKKQNGTHKAVRDADGKFVKHGAAAGKSGKGKGKGTSSRTQNPAPEGKNPRKRPRKKRNPDMGSLLPMVGGVAVGAGLTIGFRGILHGLKALAEPMKNPYVAALIANGVPGALGAVAWYFGKKKNVPVLVAIGAGMVAAATVFLVDDLVGSKIEEGIASLVKGNTDGLWFQKQQQIAAQRQQQRTGALMRDIAPRARELPAPQGQQAADGMWFDKDKPQQATGALQQDVMRRPAMRGAVSGSLRGRLTA
jgi:hypothetical protein